MSEATVANADDSFSVQVNAEIPQMVSKQFTMLFKYDSECIRMRLKREWQIQPRKLLRFLSIS